MAEGTDEASLADLYRRMADAEERHGGLWRERLEAAGLRPGSRPSWRARVMALVARRFGPGLVVSTMAAQERAGQGMYDDQPEAAGTSLPADERSHARLLRQVTEGVEGGTLARFEGRHRAVGGNALRAAVLGANDGLVSNFSLVMGVAGADPTGRAALIAGLAGLLAGALSMALGEWLSVQSARELYANQIAVEAEELAAFPQEERQELRLIYEAKGLSTEQADAMAARLVEGDPSVALDTMAREELGIDPDELGGSPWVAAGTSFVLFALGAIVPVIPFMFGAGLGVIAASAVLSGAALFLVGAGITVVTGQGALISGARQLGFGLAAAAITFGIGTLLGTAIS
ncbi:MAG TPA: VIT1/CCC1 transporter family protein, partial [Candidatus Limnocylindrales bacterium]|nr:VIT1/CCC1 transporter family protein [Candidatus Limnocylindrales bacterium]